MELDQLRYPIGRWQRPDNKLPYDQARIWIDEIAVAPAELREAVDGLNDTQLDTPYREGGWTVRQLVHHVPDSHLNAYTRFRLALTENEPTIKPYDQEAWAELPDSRTAPIEPSLTLLEALHLRWVALLESLTDDHFNRRFWHPELGTVTLAEVLGMYAWHGPHHVAHITELRKRNNW
jgi:uncharacterized damage-inducible protein DinB